MRVVVSMTTIPARVEMLRPTLESIIAQTRKPDRFVLVMPLRCAKTGENYDEPEWLDELVEIMRCSMDWGPATKLIPVLSQEDDPDTRIITVDDDVVYERHTVEELAYWSEKMPDAVLGFMGVRGKTFIHAEQVIAPPVDVDGVGGYRGVCYRRGLFDEDVFGMMSELMDEGPFLLDDQFWTMYQNLKGTPRFVVPTSHGGLEGINVVLRRLPDAIHYTTDGQKGVDPDPYLARLREMSERMRASETAETDDA